jgi:hypothetical protein
MKPIFYTDKERVYTYFDKLNLLGIVVQYHHNEKPSILPLSYPIAAALEPDHHRSLHEYLIGTYLCMPFLRGSIPLSSRAALCPRPN